MATPAMPFPLPVAFRFSRFEFQPAQWRLLVDGRPVEAQRRALQVLAVLLQHAGSLVSKDTLYETVWHRRVVEPQNLTVQVSSLRKLGIDCIKTLPSLGYRLTASVLRVEADGSAHPHPAAPAEARPLHAAAASAHAGPPPAGADLASGRTPAWHPAVPGRMLGRDDELQTLCDTVALHALVCLVGAGGSGKTLLARHVAHRRHTHHAQGACWIDLAPLPDDRGLLDTLALALDVAADGGMSLDKLVAASARVDALLVLDNADTLAEALAPVLDTLCSASPGLRVLVTSQVPLRSAQVQLHRLGGLAVPSGAVDAQAARAWGAVALFESRARALDPRFSLNDANVAQVVGICRALDGLALAILLAAGRVHSLGLDTLARDMGPHLQRLGGWRSAGVPSRHPTLMATLAWSHGLLDTAGQRVFRRMAALAGAAPLALLEAMLSDAPQLDDTPGSSHDTLDVLDQLIDRSLVAVVDADEPGPCRYRLLETPKAYALAQLEEAGEAAAMGRRHARALVALIEPGWAGPDDGELSLDDWRAQAGWLLDEARSAFDWARQAQEPHLALPLGAFLLRAWPRSMHRPRQRTAAACQLMLLKKPLPPPALAHRVNVALARCWLPSQPALAASAAQQSLQQAQAAPADDTAAWQLYQSWALVCLAAMALREAEPANQALAALQQIPTAHWPPARRAWGAEAEAAIALLHQDGPALVAAAQRRLALVQAAGNRGLFELQALMDAQLRAGDMAGAAGTGGRILSLGLDGRDDYTLTQARLGVCTALLAQGRLADARAEALKGYEHARQFDLHLPWTDQLALLAALEGQPTVAARLIGWADTRHAALDLRRDELGRAATLQARRLALHALGDAGLTRWLAEGAPLGDADIAALALRGPGD